MKNPNLRGAYKNLIKKMLQEKAHDQPWKKSSAKMFTSKSQSPGSSKVHESSARRQQKFGGEQKCHHLRK
jgi:hypothetical protein